jgi:hypothetical protein
MSHHITFTSSPVALAKISIVGNLSIHFNQYGITVITYGKKE